MRSTRRLPASGFTLIEVMITVGDRRHHCGSIALPAYFDYVRRGQLPEAFSNLADYRVKMEQYYQDNRNYGTTNCADVAGAPSWSNFQPANRKYFTYGCALRSAGQGYTVTATGSAGQIGGAKVHEYAIRDDNLRTTTKFKGQTLSTVAQCWLTKQTCDN